MSYTALYRKYRPDTFDDVKGQDHVVTTLRNQIIAGRTSHAYLFTGSRGTGKTSVAKILAKAVNCENPQNGSPCNECEVCRAIQSGASLNVIEIDAASNNGVDNVRQIREEVAYPPTEGKFKVYIIDEVHMLTPSAFNALLKTLEEPPSYVIFILATTEAHKVPVTILSRCQRYDFHRISQEEITLRLQDLLEKEGVRAEEQALRYIARKAEGGMRDALSLTDQCISFYLGEELTYRKVLDVLGAVDTEVLGGLFEAIAAGDVREVFSRLDDMIFRGRELTQLVVDLTEYVRDLVVVKSTTDAEDILDVTEEGLALLEEDARLVSLQELVRFIRILSELSSQLRFSTSKRTLLEVGLIRLCRPAMEADVTSLSARVSVLERMVEDGVMIAGAAGRAGSRTADGGQETDIPPQGSNAGPGTAFAGNTQGPAGRALYHKAAPEDLDRVDDQWSSIIEMVDNKMAKRSLHTAMRKFDPSDPAEDTLYVICRGVVGPDYFQENGIVGELEDLIEERIGKRIHVRMMDESQEVNQQELVLHDVKDAAQKRIRMPIEMVPDS